MKEVWKPVRYDNKFWPYMVSSKGRIKGVKKTLINPWTTKKGYKRVTLCRKLDCGKPERKKVFVHVLIAQNFLVNFRPEVTTEVDHIDRVRDNNKVDNLKWITPQMNKRRRVFK